MDTYKTEFRKLVVATIAGFLLLFALAVLMVFLGRRVESGPVLFVMAMVPFAGVLLTIVAHERFLAAVDEYLRSVHDRAFRSATYYEILFLGLYAMIAVLSDFSEQQTGQAIFMVLLSLPLFMFYYLATARWAVRQDAQPDREA